MTTWCTPADLLAAESDIERLAGLATPTDLPAVSGALLRLAVTGEDLAEWLPGEQQAAEAAVARMLEACANAGELVAGYLSARWPAGLDPVPKLVRGCAVSLALEDLLGARPAGPESPYAGIVRRAKAAHGTLAGLRDGTLSLGLAASQAPAAGVRYEAAARATTMDSLAGM
jgi:hypothetical protein